MFYTIYTSKHNEDEIIVESYSQKMIDVQSVFIEKGYEIQEKIDSYRFKAHKVKDDEEKKQNESKD